MDLMMPRMHLELHLLLQPLPEKQLPQHHHLLLLPLLPLPLPL